jgi:putative PIN family toxin of toxin-antitoxin system
MIPVVIDSNVVVSAALNDDGLPAAVLSLVIGKKILMFVSAPLLAEYETVLNRPRLKLSAERVRALLAEIRSSASWFSPRSRRIRQRFLECAHASADSRSEKPYEPESKPL